ncbi:MAG: YihY/virulence factor BrkB family protein [Micromonosporaceae bacterium]
MASTPTQLGGRSWRRALTGTISEFGRDNLTDWAAALTYYGILSLFPGLLVLVSVLGLVQPSAAKPLVDSLTALAPGAARQVITDAVSGLQQAPGAGVLAIVGLVLALWSASGYVGAFMRASNVIYDVPEGRPAWKFYPTQIAITLVVGLVLAISALAVLISGPIATRVAEFVGLRQASVAIWDIAKWPVLVIALMLALGLLYWAAPNARQGGFRWVTPGGVLAVVLWIGLSAGFAAYVANFGSYNKTYGTLGGVIIFLVWLWLTNIAVLLGAEFDAELQRNRAISHGHPPDAEPYVELRSRRGLANPDQSRHSNSAAQHDSKSTAQSDSSQADKRPESTER